MDFFGLFDSNVGRILRECDEIIVDCERFLL